jgi:soluble lytic murein transglycosylase-like protein
MIVSGILCLSIGGLITAPVDMNVPGRPELCMPKLKVEYRAQVREYVRARELEVLKIAVKSLGGAPEHAASLLDAGTEFQIDPLFLAAVTFVESNFKPLAASSRGAKGMMQLRPIVLEVLGVTNPWDPHENIMAGAAYLKNCFERYAGFPNSTYLALAAYNIGPGSAEKLSRSDPAERFVKKVLKVYNRLTDVPISMNQRQELVNFSTRNRR